ncbi:MAG: hypothetical protein AAB432_03215 [Patescibacteria group bacterium]
MDTTKPTMVCSHCEQEYSDRQNIKYIQISDWCVQCNRTQKGKKYYRKYQKTPEQKEYQKEYRKTPEQRKWQKEYRQTPEQKEYQKEYQKKYWKKHKKLA